MSAAPVNAGGISSVRTDAAPSPAGTYSQAVVAAGLVFLSGQTPRDIDGTRLGDRPFTEQVARAMANLAAVATAAGSSLDRAVKVTVYLRDPARAADFDRVYREWFGPVPPARTLVQSGLPGVDVEIDAILLEGGAEP